MTDYRGPELVRDDDLTRELRGLYAAPADGAYWSALEARILARIAADDGIEAWWAVPERWVRVGLLAAGIVVILAGSLFMRSTAQATRMAAEDVVVDSVAAEAFEIARRDRLSEEQATLRFLTGHQ